VKKLYVLLIIVAGLILGSGVAIYRITHLTDKEASIVNGSWMGQNLGEVGNDHLLTARVAVAALFALNPKEVIYLVAKSDAKGNELTSENDYVVKGVPLDALYWSITFYDDDYFLIPNEENRYSFNVHNVKYENDSSFVIHVSSHRKDHNWLPSGTGGKFYLVLRMYVPGASVYNHLKEVQLPTIEKVKRYE